MKTEQGIRLGSLSLSRLERTPRLRRLLDRFDWVYTGAEFCENLLETGMAADAARLQAKGKKVCLVTPLLSEKGIESLASIFAGLMKLHRDGRLDPARFEVTVNDFGALELAAREKLPFKLNLGRQLYYNAFLVTRDSIEVLNRRSLDFFALRGITRYELAPTGLLPRTNFGDKAFGFDPKAFSLTLYYPYLNLTTTRTCLVGMPYIPPEEAVRGIKCRRECRACAFKVAHPWIKEKLFIRGNTVFMEFPEKFYSSQKELAARRIDRLVYCPFP
ncbi:MAG TPA: hypothetical protein PKI19_05770 [Elusimicrobiales bacterium]|nr:hypothetical protein [Elusimicrobiales bacterium]